MKILLITLMCLILLSILGLLSGNEKLSNFSCELHKSCVAGVIVYCIIGLININEPTAMDVYQGKTTLEITYKDGIAIDSVVVFKDK